MPLFNNPQDEYKHNPVMMGSRKTTAQYLLCKYKLPHSRLDRLRFLKEVDGDEFVYQSNYILCFGGKGSKEIQDAYKWLTESSCAFI